MASRTNDSTENTSVTESTARSAAVSTKAGEKSAAKTSTRKATSGDSTSSAKPAAKTPSTRKKSVPLNPGSNAVQLTPEERQRYVSEAAYFIAERRGFSTGGDVDDWLRAESEIDQLLAGTTRH